MALTGEFGEIAVITCTVEPELATVEDGFPRFIGQEDWFEAYSYPDNCPRGRFYDSGQPLGCIACIQAKTEFVNGIVVSKNGVDTSNMVISVERLEQLNEILDRGHGDCTDFELGEALFVRDSLRARLDRADTAVAAKRLSLDPAFAEEIEAAREAAARGEGMRYTADQIRDMLDEELDD